MPADERHDSGGAAAGRERLLDELDELARIEHSLIVEHLTIHCVLGHDMAPATTPNGQRVSEAAQGAFQTAVRDMKHLHRLNQALTNAGRSAQVGRAASIGQYGGSEVTFGRLTEAVLERLIDRERTIASAVDDRYARLLSAVPTGASAVEDDLGGRLTDIVGFNSEHSSLFAELQGPLDRVEFSEFGRVTRLDPADDVERSLLKVSDQSYRLVVTLVEAWLAHEDLLGPELSGRAQLAMDALNQVNLLLAERRLLPAFSPAAPAVD